MSAVSTSVPLARAARFYDSTVGKKAVMAVTGVILFLFVVGHLLGNLQFYMGPEQLDGYGAHLRALGPLLWLVRLILLTTVIVHIVSGVQLWLLNRSARPIQYKKLSPVSSSYASRSMILTGPLVGLFIIFHVYNLTLGPNLLHDPVTGNPLVYANVVNAFSDPVASLIYIVAMVFLGLHIVHGVWSMFQSVGCSHPKYTPIIRRLATLAAVIIVLGNISIPIAVLTGFHS